MRGPAFKASPRASSPRHHEGEQVAEVDHLGIGRRVGLLRLGGQDEAD